MAVGKQSLGVVQFSFVLALGFGAVGCVSEESTTGTGGCESLSPHECTGACKPQDGVCGEYARPQLEVYPTAAACMTAGHDWDSRGLILNNRCYHQQQSQAQAQKSCNDRSAQECTPNVGCALVGQLCLNAQAQPPCNTDKQDICEAQGDKCLWNVDHCYNVPEVPDAVDDSTCQLKKVVNMESVCNGFLAAGDCEKSVGGVQVCTRRAPENAKCEEISNLCRELSRGQYRTSAVAGVGLFGMGAVAVGAWRAETLHQSICVNATLRIGNAIRQIAPALEVGVAVAGGGDQFSNAVHPPICWWDAAEVAIEQKCKPRYQPDLCNTYFQAHHAVGGAIAQTPQEKCEKGIAYLDGGVLQFDMSLAAIATLNNVSPPVGAGWVEKRDYSPILKTGHQICKFIPAKAETCVPSVKGNPCQSVEIKDCGKGETKDVCEVVKKRIKVPKK